MNHRSVLTTLLFATYYVGETTRAGANPQWKVGDMWNLKVELPNKSTYIVHAIIGGVERVDGMPCWQITFLPGNGAPDHLKDKRHRVSVAQNTGHVVQALKMTNKEPMLVEKAGVGSFVTMLAEGMPIELFNVAEGDYLIPGTMRAIRIRKTDMGDFIETEQTLLDDRVEQWTIRQRWAVGEKWWHSYERIEKNQLTLSVQRMNAPPFKSQVDAKKDHDPKALAARFPLRVDPALRVKVGDIGKETDFAELLERLATATKRKLTLAENLSHHEPKFSNVVLKDVPAWMVMELLVIRELNDGRWIKTDDGYRLEGISKSFRSPTPPSSFSRGATIATIAIALSASVLFFFLLYRARKNRKGTSYGVSS